MADELHLHLVTLGVTDLARAAKFYESLGMERRLKAAEGVAFFHAGGVVLGLFGCADLAKDAGLEDSEPRFSGVSLACNVASEREVDAMLKTAADAGGKILKPAQRAFWGGYHGYFADPEGHAWEVAHNPGFSFDDRGQIVVPE